MRHHHHLDLPRLQYARYVPRAADSDGHRTLHWYTRSRRTLASSEVRAIVDNAVPLHVFVKKDDEEGADFLYLGRASSTNPVQTQMPGKEGEQLDVVTMDLQLESQMEDGLYRYLLTPTDAV